MNIIIPMAGRGSRLRPHTLSTPKPLLPIVGKPIVKRLVEDIAETLGAELNQIAFIIGDFGLDIEEMLINVAKDVGAEGVICHQREALGTAHAIYCAKEFLDGPVVVAFADTLFRAKFQFDLTSDVAIWVKKVKTPEAYGVIKLDDKGIINGFVEKPKSFVSDLAIIGIYYFKNGDKLKRELQYLIENNIKQGGEFQITDVLEIMRKQGLKMIPAKVDSWMDCGNKDILIKTNSQIIEFVKDKEDIVSPDVILQNSKIIHPCYIGSGVKLINSTVGPHVSISSGVILNNCKIRDSIIRENSELKDIKLYNSMIGQNAFVDGGFNSLNIGDFCRMEIKA